MFGKKKNIKPVVDYSNWEKDLGFLTLILTRKKGITKEFLIGTYDKQKADIDYLTDEEIEPSIQSIVEGTVSQLGDNYKNFLIEKYFGSEGNLISFIAEDVYVDIISDAINRNIKKINVNVQKKVVASLTSLNKRQ